MTRTEQETFNGGVPLMLGGLVTGLIGLAIMIWGFAAHSRQAYFSYLVAWNYAFTIAAGAMVLLFTCHAMNATWPVAIRRLIEAVVATIPALVVLFIPIFFGASDLYPFMHPDRIGNTEIRRLLVHKHAWLNFPFWIGRSVGYLAFFGALALLFRRLSLKLDGGGGGHAKGTLKVLSSALLPPLGIVVTLASFDWVMALSPDWYSTMFGVYYFAGGFLASISLIVVLLVVLQRDGWFEHITRSHYYALGRLLLAFIIFWAYIAYFQFFLTWIANKPTEARWYVDRIQGGYAGVDWFLLIGHFAIPFFVLLSYWIKQRGMRLLPVAAWLLVAHYFDVHWLIAPARHVPNAFSWLDLAAFFAVVGLSVAFGIFRQRGQLLAPVGDPSYEKALAYESI